MGAYTLDTILVEVHFTNLVMKKRWGKSSIFPCFPPCSPTPAVHCCKMCAVFRQGLTTFATQVTVIISSVLTEVHGSHRVCDLIGDFSQHEDSGFPPLFVFIIAKKSAWVHGCRTMQGSLPWGESVLKHTIVWLQDLTPFQATHAVASMPSPLEFLSYVFRSVWPLHLCLLGL